MCVVRAESTGPTLARGLARHGVKARIVEKYAGPGEASRAGAVRARGLEFRRQLGSGGPSS